MYPISYLTFILIFLLFFDKKLASYYYPFIFLTSTFGIVVCLYLMYSYEFRKIFYKVFPLSISRSVRSIKKYQNTFYILIIFFKVLLLIIWPKNVTINAMLSSSILIFVYIILYFIKIMFK